jgi:hypothetical protein
LTVDDFTGVAHAHSTSRFLSAHPCNGAQLRSGACRWLICAGALLADDFLGLRSLIWRSDAAFGNLVLLLGGFAASFGAIVSSTAIMLVPFENETD